MGSRFWAFFYCSSPASLPFFLQSKKTWFVSEIHVCKLSMLRWETPKHDSWGYYRRYLSEYAAQLGQLHRMPVTLSNEELS